MDNGARTEQKGWASDKNAEFYSQFRNDLKDLYRSEKFFLPDTVKKVRTCLDVGCACGGFSNIMKSFNPDLQYTGIDITSTFIDLAKKRYPDSEFLVGDATAISFPENTFELVHCSGIVHVTAHYKKIMQEMYRTSSKYVLCDFRLTEHGDVVGEMDLMGHGSAKEAVPYYVLNIDKLVDFLQTLSPRPKSIDIKGYEHPPSNFARVPIDKIYMAFFLIEKGNKATKETKISIDLNA